MIKKNKEIINEINKIIDNKEELGEYLKENPAFAQVYIEYMNLEIQIKLLKISRVSLEMSYLLSNNL